MTFHVGQQHTSLSDLWFSREFEMCFPLLEGPVTYSSFSFGNPTLVRGCILGGFGLSTAFFSKTAAAVTCQELLPAF